VISITPIGLKIPLGICYVCAVVVHTSDHLTSPSLQIVTLTSFGTLYGQTSRFQKASEKPQPLVYGLPRCPCIPNAVKVC